VGVRARSRFAGLGLLEEVVAIIFIAMSHIQLRLIFFFMYSDFLCCACNCDSRYSVYRYGSLGDCPVKYRGERSSVFIAVVPV